MRPLQKTYHPRGVRSSYGVMPAIIRISTSFTWYDLLVYPISSDVVKLGREYISSSPFRIILKPLFKNNA